MKKIFGMAIFLFGAIFFSCEEQLIFVDCSKCKTGEPLNTDLVIKIYSAENVPAVITIYEGNLEDNIVYSTFVIGNQNVVNQTVSINKKYTVTAKYNIGNKDYLVVDSTTPRVKFDESSCEDPCYFVYNNKVNLRLKRTR
ncbi:MAG: hypothetical protein HPY62_10805 [Bacteroidales bacterium]|nr:hypothetical protein [Bacteroidales bacterium]